MRNLPLWPVVLVTGAGMALVVALLAAWLVLDRLQAAAWMWFKFHGYGEHGWITLGRTTAWYFSCGMTGLVLCAAGLWHSARSSGLHLAARLARLALLLAVGSLAVYWLLASSGLNRWRE